LIGKGDVVVLMFERKRDGEPGYLAEIYAKSFTFQGIQIALKIR
jgi:hypothetical protein